MNAGSVLRAEYSILCGGISASITNWPWRILFPTTDGVYMFFVRFIIVFVVYLTAVSTGQTVSRRELVYDMNFIEFACYFKHK